MLARADAYLLYPNLSCAHCFDLFKADGLEPSCKTPEGCPIGEDLAADMDVDQYLSSFLRARRLFEYNGVSSFIEKAYTELELFDFPDELLKLEDWYLKLKNKSQEKKSKWNNLV